MPEAKSEALIPKLGGLGSYLILSGWQMLGQQQWRLPGLQDDA